MKNLFLSILGLSALICSLGCPAAKQIPTVKFDLNKAFDLKVGQIGEFSGNKDFRIKFENVSADSRCPKGVECITAGKANVLLTFTKSGTSHSDTLFFGQAEGTSNVVTYKGSTVRVTNVLPVKEKDKGIAPEDYIITLMVADLPSITPLSSTAATLGKMFVISMGERVPMGDDPTCSIQFESVSADSRCPRGTQCESAGCVNCVFLMNCNGKQYKETLAKGDLTKGGNMEAKFGDYTVKLTAVAPQKEVGKTEIAQKEYQAILEIRK